MATAEAVMTMEDEREMRAFDEERARLQQAQAIAQQATEDEEATSGTASVSREGMEQVRLSSYSAPLIVALFKDLLDFTILVALPGIATVIAFCLTTLIFLLLFFPKRKYRLASNMRLAIIDAFILLGLITIEGLAFPFNLLPFTVAAVGMIYRFDAKYVKARNTEKFDRKKQQQLYGDIIGKAWKNRNTTEDAKLEA